MAKLHHNLREPARTAHVVPGVSTTLLSTGKFADANYITIFDKEEVNVYDADDVKITTTHGAVLRGWRKPSGLWRIPLTKGNATKPGNSILTKASPTQILRDLPSAKELMCNVFELKTQPEIVRYYHAAAGFPTKATWLKAIGMGFFATWTGLTYAAVQRHFPESEETQKGHMRKMKAGVRSTKVPAPTKPVDGTRPKKKEKEVMV